MAPLPHALPAAQERGYRHFTAIEDLTPAQVEASFDRARIIRDTLTAGRVERTCKRLLAITCFLEPSTRTRVSFEVGALRLGMHVVTIGASDSSAAKGESALDTRLTLEAYGPDVIVVRTAEEGVPQSWAADPTTSAAIINGGDGASGHPTQALYDRFTIAEAFGSHQEKQILFVGDIVHSRVVASHVALAHRLGTRVALAGPAAWVDVAAKFARYPGAWEVVDLERYLPQADVINPVRVQRERGAGEAVSLAEYRDGWQIDSEKLKLAKPEAILMHPAPVNRDVELADELVVHPRSWIQRQAANGLPVRMALLEWCLGRIEL